MKQTLSATLEDLRMESVLVQAWKKTAAHIRQHSWYSDTVELDYQSLRLPKFISELRERLNSPDSWVTKPLELVPAPKAQKWILKGETWSPDKNEDVARKLRPLAHVSLPDQVLGTAMLMCLADRAETAGGDPRLNPRTAANRSWVLSYGHRLFCDANGGELRHRWGTTKLYRQYYQDYRTFLERPKLVASEFKRQRPSAEIAIVQSDLSKFYDRVRPELLHTALERLRTIRDDLAFFQLAQRLFNWRWRDAERALTYGRLHKIERFDAIALPQGLVASGFFANIVLREFENTLRASLNNLLEGSEHTRLLDVCYYVDDLRLVLKVRPNAKERDIEEEVCNWLQGLLNLSAPGLLVEKSKTKATVEGRDKRFLVQQSKSATRIQADVSGAFDMLHGTELIGAIEGFFHTQQRYSSSRTEEEIGRSGLLVGISDLRDDTAARFAAGKYRRTFRSLRPLLAQEADRDGTAELVDEEEDAAGALPTQLILSRQQLDERAQLFAAILIEEWVSNPGNVRLLRIALDMYPDATFLDRVLLLLRDGWSLNGKRGSQKEVRLYCLAEVFRAGATETGIVRDADCLPSGVSVKDYHERLESEAREIFGAFEANPGSSTRLPWYLMQQVFLYLCARNAFPESVRPPNRRRYGKLTRHRQIARFLQGFSPSSLEERCILLVLAVSAFGHRGVLEQVARRGVSGELLRELGQISPQVLHEFWQLIAGNATEDQASVARTLGLSRSVSDTRTPATVGSLAQRRQNPFFEEENILKLADALLGVPFTQWPDILTPWQVKCRLHSRSQGRYFGRLDPSTVEMGNVLPRVPHLFRIPDWCATSEEKQKLQLGLLLRFAIRGSIDFFASAHKRLDSLGPRYQTPVSHWEQQRYSGFQGRSGFGPPWLPMSFFTESLLFELLRWPGSGINSAPWSIQKVIEAVRERLGKVRRKRGKATKLTFLEQSASWPEKPPKKGWQRPLRVGIVQSITPDYDDYAARLTDPELRGDPSFRTLQRSHLAALLEGVSQMLAVRETHRRQPRVDGRSLDLLVFPELAIHPDDVETLLLPFVRVHKCIILCGLVYHPEPLLPSSPLINSCLWMIPEWTPSAGFQVRRFEQGKNHLAADEGAFAPPISGFRPTQWLIEYQWHSDTRLFRPLVMSASVCYDATDLALASDLKGRSDFYIVCALNKDVGTFDRMAEGLHYHMYQAVMVVNNGQFGGSNLYIPFQESYHRQVLHLHGQPQAMVAFAEVCPRKLTERPSAHGTSFPVGEWKGVPAAWVNPASNFSI